MKLTYSILFLFIFGIHAVNAQEATSFQNTLEIANAKNSKVLLIFSGSDWCAPCIKLEKKIFNTPEFLALSENTFMVYKADFPMRKKNRLPKEKQAENENLADTYKQNGVFPLVIVLNSKGKELGRASYKDITPKEYYLLLNSF